MRTRCSRDRFPLRGRQIRRQVAVVVEASPRALRETQDQIQQRQLPAAESALADTTRSRGPLRIEVLRLVAFLPLDVAADRRRLLITGSLTGEHRIERRSQVLARDRNVGLGSTRIELSAVDQLQVAIEQVEVGRARSRVSLGDALVAVEQVRERISAGRFFRSHRGGCIIRVLVGIVAADADHRDAAAAGSRRSASSTARRHV